MPEQTAARAAARTHRPGAPPGARVRGHDEGADRGSRPAEQPPASVATAAAPGHHATAPAAPSPRAHDAVAARRNDRFPGPVVRGRSARAPDGARVRRTEGACRPMDDTPRLRWRTRAAGWTAGPGTRSRYAGHPRGRVRSRPRTRRRRGVTSPSVVRAGVRAAPPRQETCGRQPAAEPGPTTTANVLIGPPCSKCSVIGTTSPARHRVFGLRVRLTPWGDMVIAPPAGTAAEEISSR